MTVQLRFAARSDVGLVRKNNQDAGYAGPHLLVLADGMGGAAGGDTASSVTIGHLADLDDIHRSEDLLPLLRNAVTNAHDELMEMSHEDESLSGMGTTCIALLRSGNKLAMIHIGDSRAYLLRGNHLIQVTKDHTLVQYLVDHGQITPEQAENHPKKNVIMRALGDSEGEVELDESVREAIVGDRWLLASDGLFGVVSNDTIAQTLLNIEDIDACADKLIDLALAGGAPDNVTVVLADVLDSMSLTAENAPRTQPEVVGSAADDFDRPSKAGTSAAGKAARLNTPDPTEKEEPEEEDVPERKKKWPARLSVIVGLILIAGGILFGTWQWTQSQYYVHTVDGHVAIYQGVPQQIGPLSLSSLVEETDVTVDELSQTAQQRLQSPVSQDSLADAEAYVRQLRENYAAQEREPATRRNSGSSGIPSATEEPQTDAETGGAVTDPGNSSDSYDVGDPFPWEKLYDQVGDAP